MDDDRYFVQGIYKTKPVEPVKRFKGYEENRKKKRKRKTKKYRQKAGFREDFFKRFGLDEKQFVINVIKSEGRWLVEIKNKKTGKSVYHDYETVCGIMDEECRLPDSMVGYNINVEA